LRATRRDSGKNALRQPLKFPVEVIEVAEGFLARLTVPALASLLPLMALWIRASLNRRWGIFLYGPRAFGMCECGCVLSWLVVRIPGTGTPGF